MSSNIAWRIVLAVMVCGILYMSLMPSPPSDGLGWDKANHAAAMGAVAIVAFLSFRPSRRAVAFGALFAITLGVVVEIAQWLFTDNRQAEWADLVADAAGVLIAMLLLAVWRYRRESVLVLLMLAVLQPFLAEDVLTVSGESDSPHSYCSQ